MQGLKIAVAVMSAMIVAGLGVIAVTIVHRLSGPPAPVLANVLLTEPPGTRIAGIAALPDRLAIVLQGGGADRIRFLDARTLRAAGEVRLAP